MIKTIMEKVEVERIKESHKYCDWCGKKIKPEIYDEFECKIIWKEGYGYPEGGSVAEKSIDLCLKCAKRLFKELVKMGIRINENSWDF
jgi:hypothetical protein